MPLDCGLVVWFHRAVDLSTQWPAAIERRPLRRWKKARPHFVIECRLASGFGRCSRMGIWKLLCCPRNARCLVADFLILRAVTGQLICGLGAYVCKLIPPFFR